MRRALLLLGCIALSLAALTFSAEPSRAETIYLKSGSKLTGKIVEQNDDAVKLEVAVEGGGSAVITIKRSRIDRIETADSVDERVAAAQRRLDANFFDDAERGFREVVRENPKHAKARMGLAKALYGNKKLAEALKILDHYLLLVPTTRDPQLLLVAAELRMYNGDWREAKELAREAAALDPLNNDLKDQSAALVKRVDRYRDGTEAAEQKAAEQKAELEKRASERAQYDRTVGNNLDACEAVGILATWMKQGDPGIIVSIKLTLGASNKAESYYARGGDAGEYRKAVETVSVVAIVNESNWLRLLDNAKQEHIYGFYYQLKQRYSNTTPLVTFVKRDADDKGRTKQTDVARGSWDGKRARLVVELWTPANVDRARQAGLKNGKR
jgi:tetratricopeptide (TPR) repeat protein